MSEVDVTRLIDRLAGRLRLVRALRTLVHSALAAAALLCLGLVWDKFRPLTIGGWQVLLWSAAAVVLAGAAAGLVRPVSRLAAAKLADVRLGLDDRLGSACAFAACETPTPFMLAHLRETAGHVGEVRTCEAVPFRLPTGLPMLGAAVVVLGVLALLPDFSVPAAAVRGVETVTLPPLRFAGERTVDGLLTRLDLRHDREFAEVMRELKKLYADVRTGELSRDEALTRVGEVQARLGDLESRHTGGETPHTWRKDVEKALAEKGAALAKDPATEALGRAMTDAKLDEASKESRSLAGSLDGEKPTLTLTPEESEALARVLQNAAQTPNRTLDVLSKHMDDAAKNLTLADMKKFAENLRKMAGELDRLKEEMEKLGGLARVGEELEELKEIVNALKQDADGEWMLALGSGGRDAQGYLRVEGVKGPDEEKGADGIGDTPEGDGTGGKPTRTDVEKSTQLLSGTWGDGTSLIEIVKGAAGEGVATTAYRDVAETAAKLAEDAVHSEDIPLGYRFYIKRYFQLIRPPAQERRENP